MKYQQAQILPGKYIIVCTCQNGQADFLNTPNLCTENGTNTQKYANNATNLCNKIYDELIIYAILAYVITYFEQDKNYVGNVKIVN